MRRAVRRGLYLTPFDELANPRLLAELAEEVRQARAGSDDPFDAWEAAGATWALTSIDPRPSEPEVRAVVDAGP